MSSALAIAAVTATLKDLLNDGLLNHDLSPVGNFTVTAQPPDRVTTGNAEANQLNIFLYQVTPNLGWRNAELPSRNARAERISNPPLALDLHYLISAYGAQDLNAEILLGYAMQLLHETPVLSRTQLRQVLAVPSPVDGNFVAGRFGTVSADDLADQVEQVKISPVYLSADELSRLWTAMQSRYRPSMAYLISVVLIQAQGGARIAPPVLQRGAQAQAVQPPILQALRHAQYPLLPALRLGDEFSVFGQGLSARGALLARFTNEKLELVAKVPLAAGPAAGELRGRLPAATEAGARAGWTCGMFGVALHDADPSQAAWSTNSLPIAMAPLPTAAPLAASAGAAFALTITCSPRLHPRQEPGVRLLFGARELLPDSIDTPADPEAPSTIEFTVPALEAGSYPLRLRVDGIDSLPITATGVPPVLAFDPAQTVELS